MPTEKYLDKLQTLCGNDKQLLNKVYRAALIASQYDAFQYDGKAFHLLEGTVKLNERGEYIFKPNAVLADLLTSKKMRCPALLKLEEGRFADLLKAALMELEDNGTN